MLHHGSVVTELARDREHSFRTAHQLCGHHRRVLRPADSSSVIQASHVVPVCKQACDFPDVGLSVQRVYAVIV